jgi:TolB-like protein
MTTARGVTSDDDGQVSVFVSYSREDRARALPVIKGLEASGLSVWWDGLLEGGNAFAKTTETALETADAVVVLWSARSVQSHWVRDEATRGRDRGRMVPVSIDGSEAPLGFRQIQYVNLSRWRGKANAPEFDELLRAIRATAAAPGHELGFTGSMNQLGRVPRRTVLVAGGAATIAVGGGLITWFSGVLGSSKAPGNSVAVLPFKNLSGDAAQAYFSDGLSEEVRSALSRNSLIQVMAPTSSNKFRDQTDDARAIAGKLGVAFLLMGSVRRGGDVVRITAALIEGNTGFSRWAETFDRNMKDVFAVQSEIAATVSNALTARVAEKGAGSETGSTKNVAAFEAYLRGKAFAGLNANEASDLAALAQFDAAIAADPGYAKAYAARSRALTVLANQYAKKEDFKALYGSAIMAAKRAVALAPDLADGYSVLGFTLFQGLLEVREARAPYDRSRALGAGDAAIIGRFASYCALTGRAGEAADAIARAIKLDPLNPLVHKTAGLIWIAADQFADAIPVLQQAITLNPKIRGAHALIGDCLFQLRRLEEARTAYLAEPQDLARYPGLAIIEHRLGNGVAARQAMETLTDKLDVGTIYQQAQVLAQWGDREAALARLVEAQKIGDSGLIFARSDPMLDPLRADPGFLQLLKALGFD